MVIPKKLSNLERGRWRTKCRIALSQHIEAKLGLRLDPSKVRLHTTREDAYSWKMLPEMQHLFSKNLSDHSIGAYKDLCDNVGVAFEAVRSVPESPQTFPGQRTLQQQQNSAHPGPRSFTSQIGELQARNNHLAEELRNVNMQLDAEVQLRSCIDEQLKLAYERSEFLQKELEAAARGETYFRNMALKYSHGISKLVPILDQLQENPGITQDGFM
ncbi:hypothetical protein NPX13_g3450 [Xylaria arbuscula]|uniref:Uncharacterized protein n=1 Tax=Xylaria arbuscula TaxID=114810 RepID=A0A9W8TN84_9PEZI|nr:hypothetical protein NPX13_g3450 [Xylaria arbuscula]